MNNSRRSFLLTALLLAAAGGACRRGAKQGGDTLPTPMSLDSRSSDAPTSAGPAATAGAAAAGQANRAPQVQGISISASGSPGPSDPHPNARDTLKAEFHLSDPDGDLVTARVSWSLNGKEIGTGETLPPGSFHRGDVVTVKVTAVDGRGTESSAASANATIQNSPPAFTSTPSGTLNGYHPTAMDPDGDAVTIEMQSASPGLSFSGGTLTFSGADTPGPKSATFVAKDAGGASVTQTLSVGS